MPEDTKYIVNQSQLTAIGTAIREKLNEQTTYTVDEMPGKIEDISGGGGGGINNPVLTINVVTTGVSGDQGALPLLQINDDVLQSVNQVVTGGTTAVYSTIVLEDYQEGESEYFWNGSTAYPNITGTVRTLSVSNEVNCTVTLNQGEGQFYAMITDPTQPASFTLTIS